MLEQLSQTIDKIYASAAGPDSWTDALASIQDLSQSAGVVVNLVDKRDPTSSILLNSPGIYDLVSESELASYNQDVLPLCPRVAAGVANPHAEYICDYMLLTEAEMDRNAAYDWYSRHGLRYFLGSPLIETRRYKLMWSFQRSPSQGHVQDRDVELFLLLKPHMARALSLADQLGTLRTFERFSTAVLDSLPQAVFAHDKNGRILFANAAAAALLAKGDGLFIADGQLRAIHGTEQARIDAVLGEAASMKVAAGSGWARVSRACGGPPYALLAAPLNVADGELIAAGARVLVVVHDTAEHRRSDPQMLTSVYGLTEAEARLASALSGGHSLESAAVLLEIRPGTARTHLKSVFRKMGVGRQQDLVRVLTSLSAISATLD